MKDILITGGTGTLGTALVEKLYDSGHKLHVFSRDENKQKALLSKFPDIKCHIGDICNDNDLARLSKYHKFDEIYHCAASKHIELCEENVHKCIETNYVGAKKVYDCLGFNKSCKFIFFTTDKAVAPINAYGYSKAIAEKYFEEMNILKKNIWMFRWGNILGSNGSVLKIFKDNILAGKPLNITNVNMTRFWITIESAVSFVMDTMSHASNNPPQLYFPPFIRSASVVQLASSVARCVTRDPLFDLKFNLVGCRPGEKIHEAMVADSEGVKLSSINCGIFTDSELDALVHPIVRSLK